MPRVKPLIDTSELRSERRKAAAKSAICAALARRGMNQIDLAKKIGVPKSTLNNCIQGNINWGYDRMAEIALALHFSAAEWAEIAGIK